MASTPLLKKIEGRLNEINEGLDSSSWKMCSIYKLPWCMKVEDTHTYTPSIVSLGPYHRGNVKFKDMDEFHKYRALSYMLKRKNQKLAVYLEVVQKLEPDARRYYEYNVVKQISPDDFSEMLLLDTCFILEILHGNYKDGFQKMGYPKKDPIFCREYMKNGILMDMILLENQIPFVVLERLYGLQREGDPDNDDIIDLVTNVYNRNWVTSTRVTKPESVQLKQFINESSTRGQNIGIQHCLDIFRQTLMYSSDTSKLQTTPEERKKEEEMDPKNEKIPSVSEMKDAGVKFKKAKESCPFWNITFNNGVMEIPQIMINDNSETIFLNLMAFEQCHLPPEDAKITSYITLLDNLVNSPSDVNELFKDDILIHTLGDDQELANVLNHLVEGIYFSVEEGCFRKLYEDANGYCKKKWPRNRALLVRDYFSSPWTIIALIAALLQLIFSFVQTIK